MERVISVRFELDADNYGRWKEKLRSDGYRTNAEFLRACVRNYLAQKEAQA